MIKNILDNPTGWPAEVIELANELKAMNDAYTSYAASYSQKLFMYQKTLGLDKNDMVDSITEIATIIQTIEDNTNKAMTIAISNQPAPQLGGVPKEDV